MNEMDCGYYSSIVGHPAGGAKVEQEEDRIDRIVRYLCSDEGTE